MTGKALKSIVIDKNKLILESFIFDTQSVLLKMCKLQWYLNYIYENATLTNQILKYVHFFI